MPSLMKDPIKNTIRTSYIQVREKLPLDYQTTVSSQVCNKIKQLEPYRYAKKIALYHACKGEIDLSELWSSAPMQGKFCYFPVMNKDKTLSFLPTTPATEFKKNAYGILEPQVALSEAESPEEIDLIFMPLVAFDNQGTRIGMGAGYYDRTLANKNHPLLIGVAYEFQQHSLLPTQKWDIPLAAIVTEKKVYWTSK